MELLKKFAKELSVFGIIIVVFLGLFTYRSITFKGYKTINQTKLEQKVTAKEDFIVVLGDSSTSAMYSFDSVMKEFTTKNRDIEIFYVDSNGIKDFDKWVDKTLKTSVTYPSTIIVEDGAVKAKKDGALQYYYLKDFITNNK